MTSPTSSRSAWTYENRLLLILFMTFGFVFFDRLALSFLFPFMSAELHLTNTQLGMVSSALALTWALSGAATGAWSDARGTRKPLLIAAVLGFSVCSALSGLVGGFASLIAFRALMGIAEGPVLPLSQSLMVESSTPSRRGLNMGLLQGSAAGLLGAMIGPPVVIGIATAYGWREAFYVSCIPGFLIAFCIWRWVREVPPGGARHAQADGAGAPAASGAVINRWALLKERNILLCVLISCFFLTWFVVIISFAPVFLVESRHLSPSDMGVVMTCLGAAWVFWGFAVPAISDRVGRKPTMIVFALIAAVCPIVLIHVGSVWALGALVFVTYTGLGCFTLFMATIPAETVPPRAIASALGLIMGAGELIGGFVAPTVAGFAADKYGLQFAMWTSATGAILACVLSFGLVETAPAVLRKRALAGAAAGRLDTQNLGGR
ncbi:MAG: MFS transporter [Burkholderia sp.]|uniref:MFS transporter n=1 Tax=Burkholderia TaxID=32008 RepID=UPI00158E9BA5|nr:MULTISPECIES: MFS transporter [Burkholderia]MBY8609665.1 MFS transporter [Burkholderia arboris]MCA3783101.1 MFS transporter [Burkholderia sp.]MCA3787978.1 MFS transporter [Burkholderia sp.]MCA3792146.1 MFS transporter [Burkholderia sp.]MCA3802844.1 MFS transporter [Burkholderia sp.]